MHSPRFGWEQIAQAGWDAAAGQLVIIGLAGAAPPRIVVPLRHRTAVPELALERVAHTKLGRWHVLIGGTRRAVIEARRKPVTGELVWFVTSGADGHDPVSGDHDIADRDIVAHVELAIARLCLEFGVIPSPEAVSSPPGTTLPRR